MGWEEGLRQAGCTRAENKSGETRIKSKREDEGSLPDCQPSVGAGGHWKRVVLQVRGVAKEWKERLRGEVGKS